MRTKLVEYVWGNPNVALVYPMAAYLDVAKRNIPAPELPTLLPFVTETLLRNLQNSTDSELQIVEAATTAAAWVGIHDEKRLNNLLGTLGDTLITMTRYPEARRKLSALEDYPFIIDAEKTLPPSLQNGEHDDIAPTLFDKIIAQEIVEVQIRNSALLMEDPELVGILKAIDLVS